ncbi:MAG: hypothetical protein Q7S65_03095, partial [Nanoarchaeota archaeon]|nr:hypothetical protein [Nanoarchaeota archaeon]
MGLKLHRNILFWGFGIILLLGIIMFSQLYTGYLKPLKEWQNRNACSHFSAKEYNFENVALSVKSEECSSDKSANLFFFMLEVKNKDNTPITWNLKNLEILG